MLYPPSYFFFFFFNDTATTEIYTLSLHDALPIYAPGCDGVKVSASTSETGTTPRGSAIDDNTESLTEWRSEEHTSELQSRLHLVCRLLLEKKKKKKMKKKSSNTLIKKRHTYDSVE